MSPTLMAVGAVVGLVVGLTGLGAGSLLTPLLVLLGVPPVTAVGSDFAFSLATNLTAAVQHGRQRSIHRRWVLRLATGSIPGVLAGSLIVGWLHRPGGPGANAVVQPALGAVLACTAAYSLWRDMRKLRRGPDQPAAAPPVPAARQRWVVPLLGAAVGVAVGFTSVGGGALISLVLLTFSDLSPRQIVGTDVAHAVLLATVGAMVHWHMGTVDLSLAANLLAGSIPGALLGSRLAYRAPATGLRLLVSSLVLSAGVTMI